MQIEKISVYQQFKEIIRDQIVSGQMPHGTKIPSERRLAKEYNISQVTVNKALSELVGEKLIVRKEGVGTFVNFSKEPNSSNKTHTLGVFVYSITSFFTSEIIQGIEDACSKRNYHLILCSTLGDEKKEMKKINDLYLNGKVDGFLISPILRMLPSGFIKKLKATGLPFIFFPQIDLNRASDINYVVCDDEYGAYTATKHLINLGHKKIGFVYQKSPDISIVIRNRFNGYQKAMLEAGYPVDKNLLFEIEDTDPEHSYQQDGYELGLLVANLPEKPTAFFCFGDSIAIGFIEGLRSKNIRVPEDIAVVGFDDTKRASLPHIQLTTIAQPAFEIGSRAANILIDICEGKLKEPQQVVLSTTLKKRKTCGVFKKTQKNGGSKNEKSAYPCPLPPSYIKTTAGRQGKG